MKIVGHIWTSLGVVDPIGSGTCSAFYLLVSPQHVFTKFLRPLVKRWRARGLRCIIYIGDGICASISKEQSVEDTKVIVDDLALAGFILNIPKSKLTP